MKKVKMLPFVYKTDVDWIEVELSSSLKIDPGFDARFFKRKTEDDGRRFASATK